MRESLKQYLKWLAPLSAAALVACSGGGSVNNGSTTTPNTGNLANLSMVAPNSYPAGVAVSVSVVVTNNGTETINNLNYSIDSASNTTGGTIVVPAASAATCRTIAAKASCTLMAQIAATPASHPGSFSIATGQGTLKSAVKAIKSLMASTVLSVNVNVGLVQMPTNTASGADGLTLYYSSTIVGSANGSTQVIVTAVVTSQNAGSFNTIQLVDGSGNPLNYTILSGNSGTGMTNLAYGSVVSFLVTVPSGSSQVQFKAQTSNDGSNKSTATDSNTIVVTDPAIPNGILNVSPNYFDLTPSTESQIITLSNSGNGSITNLSFKPTSPLQELSNNCGTSLSAGATCQYVVKFNKDIPQAGTSSLIIDYKNGSTGQSATVTVNYRGVDPVAGLTITNGSSPNFDFTTRTNTPTQSMLVTVTNSGNTNENNVSFTAIANFSTNTTGVTSPCSSTTVLAPGASCNVNLVYSNSTTTALATSSVPVSYTYGQNGLTASSNIAVSYQTLQSMAILTITPNPVTFSGITNNGVESDTQTLTVTNSGDAVADITGVGYSGVDSTLFSIVGAGGGTCSSSLNANSSCTYIAKFGPASSSVASGSKTTSATLNYTPYTGATGTTARTTLNGQVSAVQSAVVALSLPIMAGFTGGNGINGSPYQVRQNASSPTITYTLTNSGVVPANSFYISGTTSSGWTTSSGCGTQANPVTLAANGGRCTLTFTLSTATATSRNLDLSLLSMNWVDQDSPSGQTQSMSGAVYANVYTPASIAITTNPASNISVAPGGSFTITATLTGGYNVGAQTIKASTTTSGVSFTNNDCALNSQNSYACTITANVGGSAAAATGNVITLSNTTTPTPAATPTPSTVTFAIAPSIVRIYLPQTGQTPTSPLTATAGMDGYTYLGVPWAYVTSGTLTPATRFSVGSGAEADCITDNLTGLMWVKDLNTVAINGSTAGNYTTWQNALDSITTANSGSGYCGHTDWYLPNVNELASLVNQGAANPATWLNAEGFSNVRADGYWSSSTGALYSTSEWVVYFGYGNVIADGANDYYVWPARRNSLITTPPAQIPQTGQTTSYAAGDDGALQKGTVGTNVAGRFVVATDPSGNVCTSGQEVESDLQTGLMWVKAPSSTTYPWASAILSDSSGGVIPSTYCGYSDWRLPNRNELRSLVNYGQSNIATWLNSQGFSNVQADGYWSSTTFASDISNAWLVDMIEGGVSFGDEAGSYYVWPVRGGQ